MLVELRIRNVAVIDTVTLPLAAGLNVLTGETGAGKSLIIGALGMLLGERAAADRVRSGSEKATVEGVFDIRGRTELRAALDERGIEVDDDLVFKALADPTRRLLLDALFVRGGRTLSELEAVVTEHTKMTRFGVSKHLRLLEQAGLVVTRKQGREKLHYLNPVPIRLIHDRWIDKFTQHHVTALADLKRQLEDKP